jgi:hypothetical protein
MRATLDAINRALDAQTVEALPPPEPRAERTAEEIAHVRAKLAAFKAEDLAPKARLTEATTIAALPLPDEHLLANYERQAALGGPFADLAKTRITMLRKKLGMDAEA